MTPVIAPAAPRASTRRECLVAGSGRQPAPVEPVSRGALGGDVLGPAKLTVQ
jgi:hypothetical protein